MLLRKSDVLKTSILWIQKLLLQVNFWRASIYTFTSQKTLLHTSNTSSKVFRDFIVRIKFLSMNYLSSPETLKLQKQLPNLFYKKGVLKNFAKFTGKHLCQSLQLKLKKRLWRRCFPVNFAKFLRAPILKNICKWLLLKLKTLVL